MITLKLTFEPPAIWHVLLLFNGNERLNKIFKNELEARKFMYAMMQEIREVNNETL